MSDFPNGLTVTGTLSAAAGSFTTVSASTHATAQFFAMSAGLGSFPVAQGLYGYYSGGGVVAAYTNNSGTLATLSLDGTTIVFRPNGSAVGLFTTTGLEVTGALSCTGNTTLGDAAGDTLNVANGSLVLDASGNLGLGVTPSAWGVGLRTLAIGPGSSLTNANSFTQTWLASNAYYSTAWTYKNSAEASHYEQASGSHKWYTAPSGTAGNAITFTQSLAVGLGTTLALEGATSAAGCGIAFPATQVASSNANTLDDYEEGTWTPTQGAGLTVVGAFSSSGTYTKVGRQVTAYGQVTGATSVTAVAGTIMCGGLPFAAALQYQGVGANSTGATGFVVAVAGTNVWSADASSTSPTQCFSVTYTV